MIRAILDSPGEAQRAGAIAIHSNRKIEELALGGEPASERSAGGRGIA